MRGWQDVQFLEEYGGPAPQHLEWSPKVRQELTEARAAADRLLLDDQARRLGV